LCRRGHGPHLEESAHTRHHAERYLEEFLHRCAGRSARGCAQGMNGR
jgi:hypothetical protein